MEDVDCVPGVDYGEPRQSTHRRWSLFNMKSLNDSNLLGSRGQEVNNSKGTDSVCMMGAISNHGQYRFTCLFGVFMRLQTALLEKPVL